MRHYEKMKEKIEERMRMGRLLWEREAGTISPAGSAELEEWLSRSGENRALAESVRAELAGSLGANDDGALRSWQRFSAKYGIGPRKRRPRTALRLAAAIVVPLLVIGTYFILKGTQPDGNADIFAYVPEKTQPVLILDDGRHIELDGTTAHKFSVEGDVEVLMDDSQSFRVLTKEGDAPRFNTVYVPRHGDCRVTLPDGTAVVVNSESKLRYPSKFTGDTRRVWLEGEAYFEVAGDKEMPFVVDFGRGEVTVLGTVFNIEAYPGKELSRATLVEGSVACKTPTDELILTPGFQAVISEGCNKMILEPADIRVATSWTRGRFYFKNEPLGNIMSELSAWYGVDVVYGQEGLRGQLFTVETNRFDTLAKILDLMVETGKMKYRQEGRTVTIYE